MFDVMNCFREKQIKDYAVNTIPVKVNREPLYLNLEKWDIGTPLYITGQGGSGKSTVAGMLAERFHAIVISTDTVLFRTRWSRDKFEKHNTHRIMEIPVLFHPVVIEYIHMHPELPYDLAKNPGAITPKFIHNEDMVRMRDFIQWTLGKENKTREEWNDQLVIVEGTGVLYAPDLLATMPVISLDTGTVNSFFNRIARKHQTGKNLITSFWDVWKDYRQFESYFDTLKDVFEDSLVEHYIKSLN